MASLTLTIGLPGSGKTTVAKELRRYNPNTVLVSRDALREEFFGEFTDYNQDQESLITSISQKTVDKALEMGRDVIVHDMHLRKKYRKDWAGYAVKHGADFKYIDLSHVPLEYCIQRVQSRYDLGGRWVDPDVITGFHKRYLSNKQAIEAPESLVDEIKWVPRGN